MLEFVFMLPTEAGRAAKSPQFIFRIKKYLECASVGPRRAVARLKSSFWLDLDYAPL